MKTWILVANAADAKILATESLRTGELVLMRELSHPESRRKNSDLVSDKPGHFKLDSGAHSAYSKGDPKEVEADHFALQLVHELKNGWDQHKFQKLLVVAPAHFYGLLKKHVHFLDTVEIAHLSKNYIRYPLPKLHASLKEHFFG
jgi:protein required for attachment to host cells